MNDLECVNLQQEFGDRYRVGHDPASTPRGATENPWCQRIPTRSGEIYPFGNETLIVEVEGHNYLKARLSRLDCCEIHQDGDDFGSFKFHVSDFDRIAEVVKPRRKRQISEEERQRLAAIGFQNPLSGEAPVAPTHLEVPA